MLSLLSSGAFRSTPTGPSNEPSPGGRTSRRRRCAGARACRAILWAAILFAASQVVLRIGIERFRPELRDPTFEIKYRALGRLRKKSVQRPATVIFLGSSMTAHGMKAGMVDEPLSAALGRPAVGFNMATSAAGPLTHLLFVQRLLRRGIRPDMVVLEASPLLYDYPDACSDLCRFPPETLGSGDLKTMRRYSSDPDLIDDWRQAFLVPAFGHRLTILTQSASALVPFDDRLELWKDMDTHGWRKLARPSEAKHRDTLAGVKRLFAARLKEYAVARTDRVDLAALRELAALLAKECIATTLVEMPEGPLLRSLYRPDGLAEIRSEFRSIADEHGFQRIDAREDLGEEMFTDSYHLAKDGAEALTARVVREAILPRMSSAR